MLRVFLIIFILMCSASSYAKTYKWTDNDGVLHFSDSPPRNSKYLKQRKISDYERLKLEIEEPKEVSAMPSAQPKIIVLWEGPVGEAAAETLLSKITELGYASKIDSLPWEGNVDLKLYVKTQLKERETFYIDKNTHERNEITLTKTSINLTGLDNKGVIILQQRMSHSFAIRIKDGLDEAARNLVKGRLPKFEKKFETALDHFR